MDVDRCDYCSSNHNDDDDDSQRMLSYKKTERWSGVSLKSNDRFREPGRLRPKKEIQIPIPKTRRPHPTVIRSSKLLLQKMLRLVTRFIVDVHVGSLDIR